MSCKCIGQPLPCLVDDWCRPLVPLDQPLVIDTQIEYNLDYSRFPGVNKDGVDTIGEPALVFAPAASMSSTSVRSSPSKSSQVPLVPNEPTPASSAPRMRTPPTLQARVGQTETTQGGELELLIDSIETGPAGMTLDADFLLGGTGPVLDHPGSTLHQPMPHMMTRSMTSSYAVPSSSHSHTSAQFRSHQQNAQMFSQHLNPHSNIPARVPSQCVPTSLPYVPDSTSMAAAAFNVPTSSYVPSISQAGLLPQRTQCYPSMYPQAAPDVPHMYSSHASVAMGAPGAIHTQTAHSQGQNLGFQMQALSVMGQKRLEAYSSNFKQLPVGLPQPKSVLPYDPYAKTHISYQPPTTRKRKRELESNLENNRMSSKRVNTGAASPPCVCCQHPPSPNSCVIPPTGNTHSLNPPMFHAMNSANPSKVLNSWTPPTWVYSHSPYTRIQV